MKFTNELPSQKYLHRFLDYSLFTGIFRWTIAARIDRQGKIAGFMDGKGRWSIKIKGKFYQAHRLAWAYCYGDSSITPIDEIDHKDGNPLNNALDNLRLANTQKNQWNKKSTNKYAKGVKRTVFGKFEACITIDGVYFYLGSYNTVDEAHNAYMTAAKIHFGEFARAQ